MPPINVMIKPASGLCNMRCSYCFYRDEMANRSQESFGMMSSATCENVIRKALSFAQGQCSFLYQGGEPTLAGLAFFEQAAQWEQKYNIHGVKIHHALQTNGLALTEDWCRFFAREKYLIGVSIDGTKGTHDCFRRDASGGDTYLRILQSVELLRRFGVEFNILTVVNARTAPRIRRIYEQYRKLGFTNQQYIACLDPLGEAPGGREYSLTPREYGQFLIDLFEMWDLDLQKGTQPYIRQFENWVGILLGMQPESCEQCGVCGVQNVVEADGTVYPCDFYMLDAYQLGNLNEVDFEDIYRARESSEFLESSYNHDAECKACPYFSLCRGGCRRHREYGTAMDDGYRNYFCEAYKRFFDSCYGRLQEIARSCRIGV